ncbi:2,3-bisphosphoglycerate-independent phosphoglycerate mutase [Candidatus Peregrinibacteria bacterium]|nr:2,3-bisphosphoglycerate-independent phosphoglycerate mutase [Candidatus Peregrinibacteria bacterium]
MNKVLLIILDGFGEGKAYPGNAITLAKTPTITALKKKYPWMLLKASGEAVGVPEGTQGGSEVGHFTIGAGRVVFQQLEEINRAIKDGSFFQKPALLEACKKKTLHLLGMISDQGVHAHLAHLFALLELAKRQKVERIFIHAITDGRDVHERSAAEFIKQIQEKIIELGLQDRAKIATIIGRYFAMDRDENWNRLQPAYDLYALGKGIKETDPVQAIVNAYKRGNETDYYIDPIVLEPQATIHDKDAVIFFNFRSDRAREITWAFTGENDPKTGKQVEIKIDKPIRPYFVCFGPYSQKAPVVFPTPAVKNNLGQVLAQHKLKQFRLAETQKYAHVTYFFNSQIEEPNPGEDRMMIESKRRHSYAEIPEMSAKEITDVLLEKLAGKKYEFIAVNFANCDLVGHSGDLKATIKAVETIDTCLGRIIPQALKNDYVTFITGDHGNAEYMIYEDSGEPCPSHTKNPVPFVMVSSSNHDKVTIRQAHGDSFAELKDIAPTILKIMELPKPKEMTGKSLIQK